MTEDRTSRINDPVPGERILAPTVALPRRGMSGWAIFIGAVIFGIILFSILDSRRRAESAPSVLLPSSTNDQLVAAPPPLDIPVAFPPVARRQPVDPSPPATQLPVPPSSYPPPPFRAFPPPQPPQQMTFADPVPSPQSRTNSSNALVVDNSTAPPVGRSNEGVSLAAGPSGNTDRVRAAIIANRATTVPQGTLIRAVLEPALNSTNPGFARAVVSRNVYGFDGSRVLIPRGSRLVGEYRADVAPGQKRALINWTRLIRPDGVTIAIGSPATDAAGRGGVKANVDTHFWDRFSTAIFQSALDVGVNVASRQADGSVIINPSQGANGVLSNTVTPTLKIAAGASIGVFVARDLDFTDVELGR
jgi:type IV secretion system protein VirB10